MSRRLPIAGERPRPAPADAIPEPAPLAERGVLPLPTISLVDACFGAGAEEMGTLLVEALSERGLRAGLVSSAEIQERGVMAAFATLEGASIAVALGSRLPSTHAPSLTLMVTGGRLPVAWSPEARTLRDRLDGQVGGHRPAFARALADELVSSGIAVGGSRNGGVGF